MTPLKSGRMMIRHIVTRDKMDAYNRGFVSLSSFHAIHIVRKIGHTAIIGTQTNMFFDVG